MCVERDISASIVTQESFKWPLGHNALLPWHFVHWLISLAILFSHHLFVVTVFLSQKTPVIGRWSVWLTQNSLLCPRWSWFDAHYWDHQSCTVCGLCLAKRRRNSVLSPAGRGARRVSFLRPEASWRFVRVDWSLRLLCNIGSQEQIEMSTRVPRRERANLGERNIPSPNFEEILRSKLNQALFPFSSKPKCQFVQMRTTWLGPWRIVGASSTALSANWLTAIRDQCADLALRCTATSMHFLPSCFTSVSSSSLNRSFHFRRKLFCCSLLLLLLRLLLEALCLIWTVKDGALAERVDAILRRNVSYFFFLACPDFPLTLRYCKTTPWNSEESFERSLNLQTN